MADVFSRPPVHRRLLPFISGFDGVLVTALLALMALGLAVLFSVDGEGYRFESQVRNMGVALGIMVVLAQVPTRKLMALAVPLYTVGVLLLVAVALFGITKKGSTRWLNIGVVIQPSEIMKIAMPLMMAWWFQRREGQLEPVDFVVAMVILAVPSALILKQPDLGTTLLVAASGLFVIFFAGLRWRWILPPAMLLVVGATVLVIMEPTWCQPGVDWQVLHEYQRQRVCTLLDPYKDPLGKGFHIIQGMIAIGSGGFWGQGFGQGSQTQLDFIPERTTDFVFAAFSEEFGFVGVMVLLALYAVLIGRGLWMAAQAGTLFDRLVAGAMTLNVFVYAFVNMGMVSGMLPVVGVPLPFISYGGTALVTLGMGMGVLLSVGRQKRLMVS